MEQNFDQTISPVRNQLFNKLPNWVIVLFLTLIIGTTVASGIYYFKNIDKNPKFNQNPTTLGQQGEDQLPTKAIPSNNQSQTNVSNKSSSRKIIPPPNQGIYLGQSPRQPDDIQTFESAVQKVAFWPYIVMSGQEEVSESPLNFDIQTAEKAWREGYLVGVSAYEATPAHKPFTVDNLLQGMYDAELKKLAGQFRQFGKPMFFSTMREVNGLLGEWMGGFGPNGDQSIGWAFDNQKGFAEFDPQKFPNSQLYLGLGRADTCDGLERAVAAQRYYYDFFVRKEKLDFLTLDTQGWAIPSIKKSAIDEGYETKLNLDCNNFSKFYNGIKDYSDWISIDWYLVTEATPQEPPISSFMDIFHEFMKELRATGTKKPIFFTELGFCGINKAL